MDPKRMNVLIVSAADMQNVGDNIVGLVNEGIMRQLLPKCSIKYADLRFRREEVEWADMVIVGGGGIFYDWSYDNVNNYLRFIEHAHYMKKRVIVSGVGTQGIQTEYGKRRYREALNLVDLITVRDERDAHVLAGIGVRRPVHVTADLAFLLPKFLPNLQDVYGYSTPEYYTEIRSKKDQGARLLGISIASEEGAALNKNVDPEEVDRRRNLDELKITAIKELSKTYTPVLFTQSIDDVYLYQRIKDAVPKSILIEPLTRVEVLGSLDLYRLFDAVVTSRYHGMILSLLTNRPTLVLSGVNSEKSKKTILSLFPSLYDENFVAPENIPIDTLPSATDQQEDETNNAILVASETVEYIKSLLYGLQRG